MTSLTFQLLKCYVFLPDDDGRPPKHVGTNIVCIHVCALHVPAVGFPQ